MNRRSEFLSICVELMHTPYRWGGKSPTLGLDCSGLVTHALWKCGGPDWRQTHNTDRLWNELKPPKKARAGDLCLYGGRKLPDGQFDPKDVSHVMVILAEIPGDADLLLIGASDGDSRITDRDLALREDARVKTKKSQFYRSGFRGYRALPLEG